MLGASGAISAVLGAYMLLFPTSRVLTLVPFFYFLQMVRIPAVIYIGMWFVSQLFSGVFALAPGAAMGGVAWWAHIGGFLFGFAAVRLFARRRPAPRWWQDEYFPF
jgi:membrane associated rhomboid family serine protease